MKTYVWCEDSKSGYQFWKEVFETIHPDYLIESKKNNTGLRKAVSQITDDGNSYYVIMDMVMDNPDVLRENKALQNVVNQKSNVTMIKIHSFEFVLLSFALLDQWVFAKEDILKDERRLLLEDRDFFVALMRDGSDAEALDHLKNILDKYKENNSEQLAATLLYGITRNTGFETNKSNLGPCFFVDCCDWKEKQSDDICGLHNTIITAEQKKRQIIAYSVLKKAFEEVGL